MALGQDHPRQLAGDREQEVAFAHRRQGIVIAPKLDFGGRKVASQHFDASGTDRCPGRREPGPEVLELRARTSVQRRARSNCPSIAYSCANWTSMRTTASWSVLDRSTSSSHWATASTTGVGPYTLAVA